MLKFANTIFINKHTLTKLKKLIKYFGRFYSINISFFNDLLKSITKIASKTEFYFTQIVQYLIFLKEIKLACEIIIKYVIRRHPNLRFLS